MIKFTAPFGYGKGDPIKKLPPDKELSCLFQNVPDPGMLVCQGGDLNENLPDKGDFYIFDNYRYYFSFSPSLKASPIRSVTL